MTEVDHGVQSGPINDNSAVAAVLFSSQKHAKMSRNEK